MKHLLVILILLSTLSCQNKNQSNTQTNSNTKSENEIIEAVKKHPISESFTVGQIIDSLSSGNGITTWQLAQFKEYANNNDIIGVIGETTNQSFGSGIKFKIAYIYQISTKKINYYAGFMNENPISEIDFLVSYQQAKMLDF